ncbi:MAG: aminopeptidase P N-terminal domain-containing protein [Gammaproteobacteria bacterium]
MTGPTIVELDEYAGRRARLMQAMGPDGIAIVPAAHEVIRHRDTHYRFRQHSDFRYLTGFQEPEAIAVLAPGRPGGEYLLFVRPRDATREIWDGFRAGPEGAVKAYRADQAFNIAEFAGMLPGLLGGRSRVYYTLGEHAHLDPMITATVRDIRDVSRRGAAAPFEFVVMETTLHEQRLLKAPAEVELMQFACDVSARAHVRAMKFARPGVWEYQLAAEIYHTLEMEGMEAGYQAIVGTGANACILHYVENTSQVKDGDLVLIDAGGEHRGYNADITRCFPASGKFSPAQKAVYEVVLDAQLAAIEELKVGNLSSRPHEVATRKLTEGMVKLGLLKGDVDTLIKDEQYRRFFMHGTGHWLGMDVHDVGRYKLSGAARPFAAGMVMTVEPGLYVSPGSEGVDRKYWGIGVRIEDDVLVTDRGPRVLTAGVPKKVSEIEALMRG